MAWILPAPAILNAWIHRITIAVLKPHGFLAAVSNRRLAPMLGPSLVLLHTVLANPHSSATIRCILRYHVHACPCPHPHCFQSVPSTPFTLLLATHAHPPPPPALPHAHGQPTVGQPVRIEATPSRAELNTGRSIRSQFQSPRCLSPLRP